MSASKVYNSWDVLKPVQANLLPTIKMISFYKGETGDCALLVTHDGTIYAVGKSTVGCLGLGEVVELTEPRRLKEISGVSGVSMSGDYGDALAITTEGKLYTWGANSNATNTPTLKSELSDIVDAKCSGGNYLALTKDGKVYQWRGVTFLQSTETTTYTPTMVQITEVAVGIACGAHRSLVTTKNGNVYSWGKEYGEVFQISPQKINVFEEFIVKVACSGFYNLVLTESGKIFSWGKNSNGLGNGTTSSTSVVEIGAHITSKFVDIAVSNYRCAAATEEKYIYIWGKGASASISRAREYDEIHQVFAGSSFAIFLWIWKTIDSINEEGFGPLADKLKNCFNCEDWSDLTIIIDGKPIYVQTLILKLRSNYFQTMLQEHWTGKNTREIKLSSFSYAVYLSYIWYLYSGEVKIPVENILELWSLADEYNEENLKNACKKLMDRNLTSEDLAKQAVLMKKNNLNTYQEDESATSLQSEHMIPEIQKLILQNAIMQKDFAMKLETFTKDYNRQQGELATLQDNYTTQQKNLKALQDNYTTLQNEHTSLKNNYTTQQKNLQALQNNYTTQQENLQALQNNYTTLQYNYTTLQNDYARHKKELETVKSRLYTQERKHTALEKQSDIQSDELEAVQSQLSNQQRKLTKMRNNF